MRAATRVKRRASSEKVDVQADPTATSGKLIWPGEMSKTTPSRCTGVLAAARTQGKAHATREAPRRGQVMNDRMQPDAREGEAGRSGVAERL